MKHLWRPKNALPPPFTLTKTHTHRLACISFFENQKYRQLGNVQDDGDSSLHNCQTKGAVLEVGGQGLVSRLCTGCKTWQWHTCWNPHLHNHNLDGIKKCAYCLFFLKDTYTLSAAHTSERPQEVAIQTCLWLQDVLSHLAGHFFLAIWGWTSHVKLVHESMPCLVRSNLFGKIEPIAPSPPKNPNLFDKFQIHLPTCWRRNEVTNLNPGHVLWCFLASHTWFSLLTKRINIA